MQETWVQFLGREDALEEGLETLSSIVAWQILRTEEPGRLQSMGSQRVRHDWAHGHEWARACAHTHTHTPNMFKRGFMFLYQVSSPYNLLHLVDFFPFLTRLSPIFTPSGNILALCKFWLLCITSTKSTWSELSSVLVLVTIIGSQLLLTGPFHASPQPHI